MLEAVVGDGEEGPAERVGVRDQWGVAACTAVLAAACLLRGRALRLLAGRTRSAGSRRPAVAGGTVPRRRRSAGSSEDRVVDVPVLLPPRVEHHLLPGVVGVQRGDHPRDRVVEQHRAHADPDVELEAVGVGEERLVLPDRLALVVEDGPAVPTQRGLVSPGGHLRLPVRADDDAATRRRGHGVGPGSACAFFWISRPKPSE